MHNAQAWGGDSKFHLCRKRLRWRCGHKQRYRGAQACGLCKRMVMPRALGLWYGAERGEARGERASRWSMPWCATLGRADFVQLQLGQWEGQGSLLVTNMPPSKSGEILAIILPCFPAKFPVNTPCTPLKRTKTEWAAFPCIPRSLPWAITNQLAPGAENPEPVAGHRQPNRSHIFFSFSIGMAYDEGTWFLIF